MPRDDHVLTTRSFIPRPRPEVFAFFGDAENLGRITPPELNFTIRTPTPIQMTEGSVIEYRLRLFGMPFSWTTLISSWEDNRRFVDEQVKGPYAKWIHTHTFEDADKGTQVTDEVRYRLPIYPIGEIAYPLVHRQLKRIFSYRARRLRELLGPGGGPRRGKEEYR